MQRLLSRSRRLHPTLPLALVCGAMALVAGFSTTATGGQEATSAAPRPMTVDDALRLVHLGDVLISPDGTQVFYSVSELDWQANKRRTHYKHEARFSNLWVYDVAADQETRLTDEEFVVGSFDISADGQQVILAARPDERTNYPFLSELYLYERTNGRLTRLTDNRAPERGPLWAPDGNSFLYRASSDADFDLRCGYFWIMDVASRRARRLDGQNQGEVDNVAWTADGRGILFNETHGVDTNLYRLDVDSGDLTALTHRPGSKHARAYSADRGHVVFSYENFTTPADLWAVGDTGGPVRLTDVNPVIGDTIAVADGELLAWSGKGGMPIEGVFMNSLGHESGHRQPLIVHVHGGPAGAVINRFSPEFQVLAGLGYAIAHRDIDPQRLGVRGWSWGGVATSYAITQTGRFKAASVGGMVGNWAAETGPGFNFDVSLWYIGGTPWNDPEEWAKRSSITYVNNVMTPTIIFHGGRDETSSVGQSLMFFTALRDIGKVPVRYIKFPRQEHGIEEPRLERVHLIEEIRWFEKYIEGLDGEPWEVRK